MPFIQWRWAVAIGGLLIAGIGTMLIRSVAADRPSAHWDPARADTVPTRIGDWRMLRDVPPDQGQMQRFKRLAAVERVYSRGEDGPQLVVFLVYGNTMEAMHFPEHCLRAGGWGMNDMNSISVPVTEDEGEVFDATLIKAAKHPDKRAQELYFFADAHTTSADWLTLVWRER
ncbi:MAG: exosortase-associated EpsI family protein, partial [Chloroflexi bacterium]|nr:exosortase-associated EpsI family protein [Chloroflexota bacterium]